MLIDRTLAASGFLWDNPIGRQIYAVGRQPWTIVGIVEDVRRWCRDDLAADVCGARSLTSARGAAGDVRYRPLTLSALGVYAVLAYAVGHRELGVRRALGASGVDLAKLVVGQVLTLILVGLSVGILLVAAGTRTSSRCSSE